jgi:isocitrate dehydrogenase (NAD+)
VNVTVIRENCEGEYSGLEHEVVPGVVESVKVMSKEGCTRIAEFAFEYAFLNNRKKVTAVHKANIQKMADGLFLKVCRDVAKKYPQIQFQDILIDNCCEKASARALRHHSPLTTHLLLLLSSYDTLTYEA